MKKIIIIIAVLLTLGGVGFWLMTSRDSSSGFNLPGGSSSPAQLLGLWQRNEEGGFVFFLEFKENEFCPGGSGRTPEKFICSQWLSYSVNGDMLFVNGSPWAEWKVVNGKLELKPRSQTDEAIYTKVQ